MTHQVDGSPSPELTGLDPDDNRYPGGKGLAGLHQWIIERLPDHVQYAEPFCGKGGVYRHKVPALTSWLIDRDADVVAWFNRRLQSSRERGHTCVIHGCGIQWMERARRWATPDLLVYCDPTYLPQTRVRQDLYRYEMSVKDHERFLLAAVDLPCAVVISGYPSALYSRMLAGWMLHTRQVVTRGGSLRTECLWVNSPAGQAGTSLLYGQLGSDYRMRERVARKVQRWSAKFAALPPVERRAILLAMLKIERNA